MVNGLYIYIYIVKKRGVIKYFIIKRDFQSTQDYLVKSIWNIDDLLAETKILDRTSHYGLTRTASQYCTSPSENRLHKGCAQFSRYPLNSLDFARPYIIYPTNDHTLVSFCNNIYLCICICQRSKYYFIQISRYRKYIYKVSVYHITYVLLFDK